MNTVRRPLPRLFLSLAIIGILAAIALAFWARMPRSSAQLAETAAPVTPSGNATAIARTATERQKADLESISAVREQQTDADERLAKFAIKYEKRISFPEKYDGQPSADMPVAQREKIIAIHKRYWRNFAQIDQAKFAFTCHTFRDGKPANSPWDMNAQVEMQYGHGIDIQGEDGTGKPFHWTLNRDGMQSSIKGDISSMVVSMFEARFARPEQCAQFSALEEDVALEGNEQSRYDVLIGRTDSDSHPRAFYDCRFYVNRATGMLERIVWCNPPVKERFGYYPHIRISYAPVEGVYIPVESVMDAPDKGTRIIQQYTKVILRKKAAVD